MCRVLGCVATEPVTIRHELLEAENPLIRQSELHDSGWGVAVHERPDAGEPHVVRCPEAAHADGAFRAAGALRGRLFNAHVRRATVGGLSVENTHPFCYGSHSFSHNGTLADPARLEEPGTPAPAGETDSERLFGFLLRDFDREDAIGSLRRFVTGVIERTPFSALNFLFCDGERLYAYRLGIFGLHWLHRGSELFVASERVTDEPWHTVGQDVLLVADPEDIEEPHALRLVGDAVRERAVIGEQARAGRLLRGSARGRYAAARAEAMATTT